MSTQKNLNTYNSLYLENSFWKKESLMNGKIILHTIKCKKISDQVVKNLQQNDFKLESVQRESEIVLNTKNIAVSTEIQEVQVDKIRVTEGSIVSITSNGAPNKRVVINENEPHEEIPDNYPEYNALSPSDFKKIERERLVFRNEVARTKNSFFFRAKDSENLFGLGDNFYKDFKAGYKHFSFATLTSPEGQKKSILGIASFMYYFENLRILIVTNDMISTFYEEFKKEELKSDQAISVYPDFTYTVYKHEGLNYLEVGEILAKSKDHNVVGIEHLLKKMMDDYDVVLYDLPAPDERKAKYEVYFPLLQMIQNVTFTLSLKNNTFKQVDELKDHFLNYKIKLKGCVIEKNISDKGPQ